MRTSGAGIAIFTVASALSGFSWSEASIIGARGLQGFGAAMLSPAALAILMTTFAEVRERNIALGVWGATGGFGAAAGVLFGGILTDLLSWSWIFFVNIPVGVAALALTPVWVMESRDLRTRTFDVPGAALITGALGIAALSAIATTITSDDVATGAEPADALVDGFTSAFWVGAAIAAVGVAAIAVFVRRSDLAPAAAEPAPVAAG